MKAAQYARNPAIWRAAAWVSAAASCLVVFYQPDLGLWREYAALGALAAVNFAIATLLKRIPAEFVEEQKSRQATLVAVLGTAGFAFFALVFAAAFIFLWWAILFHRGI